MKILILFVLMLSSSVQAAINFTDKEKAYLKEKGEIRVCIDPVWEPLESNQEGKHVGMSSDYLRIIEKKNRNKN